MARDTWCCSRASRAWARPELARELAVYARLQGAHVLQGGCYEFEVATPYLPLVEALRAWVHGRDAEALRAALGPTAPELAKLAPEIGATLGPLPENPRLAAPEERLRLFDNVTRFLQGLAAARGLLLVLDDLHWADHGTLALLHYLLRQARESRLLVLGAYREAELDRAHPLQKSLVEWNRERLATRLPLGRLSLQDTGAMLAVLFGQDEVSPEFAQTLFSETEGNPFFVEEVVKALIEQGQIYREAGEWQRKEVAELAIPQSIKAAVSRRLDRLGESCTEALRTAAALGKTFAFRELAAVATLAEDPLLDALDEASASQLIRAESGEVFAFTHDKIREVLHEELNPIRRRRLHQRVGESLEKLYAGELDAHVQDLAHHFTEGGDLRKGLAYSIQAGEKAEGLYALEEARRFHERARQCAETLEDTAALADLEERLGDIVWAMGESKPAIEHYERSLGLAHDAERRTSIEAKLGEVYARVGDPRGVPHLEKALQALDPERQPGDMARALATLGRYHHYRCEHRKATEYLERSLRLAENTGRPGLISLASSFLAGAYQHQTRFEESNEWAHYCIRSGEERRHGESIALGHEFLAENANNRGLWEEALHHARLDREWGERIQSQERMVWADYSLGWALHGRGDLAQADRVLKQALAHARRIGENRVALFLELELAATKGDLGADREAWELAERVYRDVAASGLVFNHGEGHRRCAYLHALRGEWAAARERCEAALGLTLPTDNRIVPMLTAPLLAEAVVRLGQLDEAPRCIADALERARFAGALHHEALTQRVEALFLGASGDTERAERSFAEAVATLERIGSRLELARTLYERGLLRRARGDRDGARRPLAGSRPGRAVSRSPRSGPSGRGAEVALVSAARA